jgi:esterase/lipase
MGSESHYAERTKPLTKLGYICLAFNLRGHGDSSGDINAVTLADNLKDAISAYDFLASQNRVNKKAIHVVGSSYGGYLTAMLSSKRKPKSLVLRAPAIYKDSDLNSAKSSTSVINLLEGYKTRELDSHSNKALRALSKFNGKILLIECGKDERIPHKVIESIIMTSKKNALTHEIIRGADHRFSKRIWELRFRKILADWFSSQRSKQR